MSKKKFALRLNEDTMKAIEVWAASEFRSVNGQIEWMLTQSLKNTKRLKATKIEPTDSPVEKIKPKPEAPNSVDKKTDESV